MEMGTAFIMIKMMREMMEIIEKHISVPEGRNYPKDRLISDLKQLANRLVAEEPIEKEYQCSMTEEERIYLTLNIKRMKDLYLC